METINQTFNRIVEQTKATSTGTGGQYSGLCPAHNDSSPSLSLTQTEDRILIKCHSGCNIKKVCSGLGIKESDLFKKCGSDTKTKRICSEKKNNFQADSEGKVQFYSSKHKSFAAKVRFPVYINFRFPTSIPQNNVNFLTPHTFSTFCS